MLRKNSLILIIAVLLVLLFESLRFGRSVRARLCLLGMAVCLAVTSVGILPLVQKCYEKKAGNTLSSGVTAMSYFAMGMQEASGDAAGITVSISIPTMPPEWILLWQMRSAGRQFWSA